MVEDVSLWSRPRRRRMSHSVVRVDGSSRLDSKLVGAPSARPPDPGRATQRRSTGGVASVPPARSACDRTRRTDDQRRVGRPRDSVGQQAGARLVGSARMYRATCGDRCGRRPVGAEVVPRRSHEPTRARRGGGPRRAPTSQSRLEESEGGVGATPCQGDRWCGGRRSVRELVRPAARLQRVSWRDGVVASGPGVDRRRFSAAPRPRRRAG